MNDQHFDLVAREVGAASGQVRAAADLLSSGSTVPFVARYRKEATGSLDEVQLASIRDRLSQLADLDKRRDSMLASLRERGLATAALERRLAEATTRTDLEDLYLPHRPRRRTRATIARDRGLEPLARALRVPNAGSVDVRPFIDAANEVPDREAALAGARDILAEEIAEDPATRAELRRLFEGRASLTSTVIRKREGDREAATYRDYFDWSEPLAKAPSHRILAVLRGSNEGILRVRARPDRDDALVRLRRRHVEGRGFAADQVDLALSEAYDRLLLPSLEREALKAAKERADAEAIRIFATNLRELLMEPPLRGRRLLAIDPGFRTGCKMVALDAQGTLIDNTTIYPSLGETRRDEAAGVVREWLDRHGADAIAVGNGTAGRETQTFLGELGLSLPVIMVDESGASIYSASEVAREELPDHDLTVRGAVSIGRRLQDPLAELVKLDPRTIGVGQYQHDVDEGALRSALDDTVVSCVNAVGVDLNSASVPLFTYVAGLGPSLARNIVEWREAHGAFRSRGDLLDVPRLGARAFEQAAGFLRVTEGAEPLDASAVHPERYGLVERMARDQECGVADLLSDPLRRARIEVDRYVSDEVGRPTLDDILAELARPGRDPRGEFEAFTFADVHALTDLKPGMVLPGIVTNVTAFGAFVDVGVHQDGLVHVSQLADRYVKDPHAVVRVRQQVRVRVNDVDLDRGRIALSMKGLGRS